MGIRRFALSRLMFALASDICKARAKFGGLDAHLTHISTILSMSIAGGVGTALDYRRPLTTRLREKSRHRPSHLSDLAALLLAWYCALGEQDKKKYLNLLKKTCAMSLHLSNPANLTWELPKDPSVDVMIPPRLATTLLAITQRNSPTHPTSPAFSIASS